MAKTNLGRVMPVDRGAYSSSTTYSKMDMVHSSDSTYVSKVNNNKGHAVTDTNYWSCYADGKQATAAAAASAAQREADHAVYLSDHQQAGQDHSQYQADHASIASKANVCENAVSGNLPMVKPDGNTEDSGIPAANVAQKDGAYDGLNAGNLTGWSSRGANVNSTMTSIARTTAGDESIDSGKKAALLSVVPKNGDFAAASLVSSGFNLLNGNYAAQIGSTGVWYFVVPVLSYGSINTSTLNNGVLFTDSNGNNLKPTVYMKDIADGVPVSATDGVAASYTDAGGYRFHTTPSSLAGKVCYMIVSGITRSSTCAHIGWSGNYSKYVSPTDSGDGGTTVSLSAWLSALHATEQKALWLSPVVCDRLDRVSGTTYRWTRMVSITTPTWTTTEDEVEEGSEQTYTHTATITGMLTDGMAALYDASNPAGIPVSVTGNSISVQNNSPSAPSNKVKYQLATIATGTITIAALSVEDWGLETFTGAYGEFEATIVYSQGFPDAVAGIVLSRMGDAESNLMNMAEAMARELPDDGDADELPMLCGQPRKLYGTGAPEEATVPSNWRQLADGGYNWYGLPTAVGQEYIDTENGAKYEAVWNDYAQRTLKWLAV